MSTYIYLPASASWLLIAALFVVGSPCPAQSTSPRAAIDAEFRTQLAALAAKCDDLGLSEQARQTRDYFFEKDSKRQYLFLPPSPNAAKPGLPAESELQSKWRAKLTELRRAYAGRLFELAKQQSETGSGTTAYQWLHEVLHHDQNQADARRVLVLAGTNPRPRSRQPQVTHTKYGWQRGKWWQIDSPHFQIATDAGLQPGMELAERLEEFHSVWRQVFFEYWSSRESLVARFTGMPSVSPAERKHQVVFFRDREEYLRQLSAAEPKIALTHGYYLKGNQTSYFYAGEDDAWAVWHHEAAHQLFQETGDPSRDVGEKWNFWVVEGIAVYLESAVKRDGYFTLGGFDADRLQFVRTRVLGGERSLQFADLAALGREAVQQHPDIRRLYTQSAGLAHFLMDGHGGRNRDEFVRKLAESYAGRDTPQTYLTFPECAAANLDTELKDFLTVTAADFRFLGPAGNRRNLSLAGAKLDDESLRQLAGSERLEWLDLAYTPITDAGIEKLGPLPSLKRLTLVNTRVSDGVVSKLAPPPLPCLEELDLSGTAITDAGLESIAACAGLKVLRLSHTAITDAGLKHLVSLRNLTELDVEQAQVTAAALMQLKSQLPKLQ